MQRARTSVLPPAVSSDCTYTPYFCEENIYLLATSFHNSDAITQIWDINVVFISNHTKTVALWCQKQSRDPDLAYPVVWDYHCILVLRPHARAASASAASDATWAWVFDYDSRLAMPSCWSDYVQATFQATLCESILDHYRCQFRIVPVAQFLDNFASDRSHMLKPPAPGRDPDYTAPPPAYPLIVGQKALENGVSNNLMPSFVDMSTPGKNSGADLMGTVLSDVEFWEWGQPDNGESCQSHRHDIN